MFGVLVPPRIFRIYIACARGPVALAGGSGVRLIVSESDHTLTILVTRGALRQVTNFDDHVTRG